MTHLFASSRTLIATGFVFLAMLVAPPVTASDIEKQRELFNQVFATVERGDWDVVDDLTVADHLLLQQYVLWPDLRATWLRVNIKKTPARIWAFLRRGRENCCQRRNARARSLSCCLVWSCLSRYPDASTSFLFSLSLPHREASH